MKQKTLTFGKPEDITGPGDDGVRYRYPFTAIDSELVGSPEEARVTRHHRLTVKASDTRLQAWNLSREQLEKELFEIGRRQLLERAAQRELNTEEVVRVNATLHTKAIPFDPSRIPDPAGVVVTVEPRPRRIGF